MQLTIGPKNVKNIIVHFLLLCATCLDLSASALKSTMCKNIGRFKATC